MELPKDPVMLLSVINTELRDKYPSLDALCEDREITKTSITDTLKGIDYEYDNIRNQFISEFCIDHAKKHDWIFWQFHI